MKKVYIYVFITAFLFGTMEVSLKIAGSTMDPFQLTFIRFFIGALVLMPFAFKELKTRNVKLSAKDLVYLFFVGICAIPVSMLLFQIGILYSNASTAAVIFCINPLFIIIFAHFIGGEKFNSKKAVVLLFGVCGLFFMIRPWDIQEGNTVTGVILMLLAALTFGLYTVLGKIATRKMGLFPQTSISFLMGSLVLLVIIIIMDRPVLQGVADNILIVLYISIFVTGIGYYCYFMAIKYSDAATGSMAFFLKTVIAPIVAAIVLGDTIIWNTYIGIALIMIASYLNIRENRRAAKEAKLH